MTGLVEELGGQRTPSVGFAMGEDRLIDIFEKYNTDEQLKENIPELYIASLGQKGEQLAQSLSLELRKDNIFVETDLCQRSMKASLKYADKIKAKYVIVIGEDEVNQGKAKLKKMETGEEIPVELDIKSIIKQISK